MKLTIIHPKGYGSVVGPTVKVYYSPLLFEWPTFQCASSNSEFLLHAIGEQQEHMVVSVSSHTTQRVALVKLSL